MKRVAQALGVSRPHLSTSSRASPASRGGYDKPDDAPLLTRIERIIELHGTYGYRRVTALLNREPGAVRVNHKRIYRVMKNAELLLASRRLEPLSGRTAMSCQKRS